MTAVPCSCTRLPSWSSAGLALACVVLPPEQENFEKSLVTGYLATMDGMVTYVIHEAIIINDVQVRCAVCGM